MKRIEYKEGIHHSTLMVENSHFQGTNPCKQILHFADQYHKPPHTLIIYSEEEIPQALWHEIQRTTRHMSLVCIGAGWADAHHSQLFETYADAQGFAENFDFELLAGRNVALKGADSPGFRRVEASLMASTQPTVLEIDLGALRHNLQSMRRHLAPSTRVLAMIKANAYGSGHLALAHALAAAGAEYFGVATVEEGVALRHEGIAQPIVAMLVTPEGFRMMYRHNIQPVAYSLDILQQLANFLAPRATAYPVQLKIDTGMHRMGIEPHEIGQALEILNQSPQIQICGLMTHLASTDEPQYDPYTHQQCQLFGQLSQQFAQQYTYAQGITDYHALNSAAVARLPQWQFNMVRTGIGLLGYSDFVQDDLRPIAHYYTQIVQIKDLPTESYIGYNRRGKLHKQTRVGVVPVGYSDGINRLLSQGNGHFWYQGQPLPIIGNVSMNIVSLDLSQVPQAAVGDRVDFFSPQHHAHQIARQIGTITYEILTNVPTNIRRVYIDYGD